MDAKNYEIGKKIKNKETNNILKLEIINNEKMWVDTKWGDTFDWVDEDLYKEIN